MRTTSVDARAGAITVVLVISILLSPLLARAGDACTSRTTATGWQTLIVHSGATDRKVSLYVPAGGVGRTDLPLVFDLHGSGGNGHEQALRSGLSAQADSHGFLLANPDGGIAGPKNPTDEFYWHIPGVPLYGGLPTPADAPDEVQFFSDAIDEFGKVACIDPRRIYVTGFSGGARMASLLACKLSSRIAAIAPVAGLRAGLPREDDLSQPAKPTCVPHRPMSIISFHGVHDPVNRYNGDGQARWGYGVPAALARWAELDGCQAAPSQTQVSTHVKKVHYLGCRAGAELIFYETDAPLDHGGGHIWPHPTDARPSTSPSATDAVDQLDASALIWEFFARHRGDSNPTS